MSNIAIKGATTGTGTFTIESPATNTDRTLTLPDEAGTVLTSAATVSSVPAMIDSGTWTPSAEFSTANPSGGATTGNGIYQRLGNYVTVSFMLENIDITGASGELQIKGLPYAPATQNSVSLYYGSAYLNGVDIAGGSAFAAFTEAQSSTGNIQVRINDDNTTAGTLSTGNLQDGVADVRGTINYYTTEAFS